jgi:hypothetical protein
MASQMEKACKVLSQDWKDSSMTVKSIPPLEKLLAVKVVQAHTSEVL